MSNTTITIDSQPQFEQFYSQVTETKDNINSQIQTLTILNVKVSDDQLKVLHKHLTNLKDLNYITPTEDDEGDDDDSDEGACRCCRNDRY
ncbi:hypothetical protein INT46_010105, partial [Mucor plumbeus]